MNSNTFTVFSTAADHVCRSSFHHRRFSELSKGMIYIQRVIAGLIIHAILFFRFTTVPDKGKPTTCFYHLRRILLRAHGTLLVRAIKKRSAPWSGCASSISAVLQGWEKRLSRRRWTATVFVRVHTYTHDAIYITDGTLLSRVRVRGILSKNARTIMPKQYVCCIDCLQQQILIVFHSSGIILLCLVSSNILTFLLKSWIN